MQPRTLVIIIVILPILASNLVLLLSAYNGFIPWCFPYIDGCTTISKAARSGDSIFIFRVLMITHAVLLIWFWLYVKQWLDLLYGYITKIAYAILWLGILGALSLMVYVDFLGTEGEINRFMRRFGILVFFLFTPIAQVLLLRQHYKILPSLEKRRINTNLLHYQFIVVVIIMLLIGLISAYMEISGIKTYESENIVEWNIAVLMQLYLFFMTSIWKEYKYYLK